MDDNLFRKGLALQREQYKQGRSGDGVNNFDMMCDAIENIKGEIKSRCIAMNRQEVIKRVERIIHWYRTLEFNYSRNTPEGKAIVFPHDINIKINRNLSVAYELLVEQLDNLKLL